MPAALRVRLGLDGEVGYNILGDGPMARAAASVAADRSAELIYHPIGFIQAAYAPGNQLTEDREGNRRRLHLQVGALSYTMSIDRTNRPTEISRVVDPPMLGDVPLRVELSEWRDAAGLTLPMRIVQRQLRWTLSDLRFTSARIDRDPGNLAVTDSVRAATPTVSAGPPSFTVVAEEIAPGVWILDSGLYHTIAIE